MGAGDEDDFSVLMKDMKSLSTGMSAIRVQKRAEREEELVAQKAEADKPKAGSVESFERRFNEKNVNEAAKSKSREQTSGDSKKKKSKAPADLIPGKDVPMHSTYLRSAEYLNRGKIAMMEEQKEEMRKGAIEKKKKGLSSMAAAFRQRQEAKKLLENSGGDSINKYA